MITRRGPGGVLTLALCLCLAACGRRGSVPEPVLQWAYRPIDSAQREIVIRPPDFFAFGHMGVSGEVCPDTSPLICFRTSVLSFAVPRRILDTTTSWKDGDVLYTVTAHRAELLLGQQFDAYFISSTVDGNVREFMFSPERGLLSMRIQEPDSVTQVVSIEYCGFGAPTSCRR
jgi:hypothetical protein